MPNSRHLDLPYGLFHYLDFGSPDRPPLLLSHGTGLHSWTWKPIAEALNDRFHVLAFDHRGHGDSIKSLDDLGWDTMADDLASFVAALNLQKPHVVGHSMGGATAALAEGRNPGLFGSLTLIDPIFLPPSVYGVKIGYEQQPMAARTIKRRYEWDSRDQMMAAYQAKLPFKTWRPDSLELYVHHGVEDTPEGKVRLKCPPKTEADCYLGGHRCSPWPYLPKIAAPTLIIRGTETDTASLIKMEPILRELRSAKLVEMPGTHFLPMEYPEALANEILSFG